MLSWSRRVSTTAAPSASRSHSLKLLPVNILSISAAASTSAMLVEAKLRQAEARPRFIGMKLLDVLLIDDDQNDCGLFGTVADKADLNIRLQTVTDGEQAIDYLEGRGVYADRSLHPLPALVVLDLDMRLTRGFDFLDWHRASASFSSLPVVILSEFAYAGTIETALAMGANSFIIKPVEFDEWEAVARRVWELGMERIETMQRALPVGG